MRSNRVKFIIVAVFFSVLLIMSRGGAQASGLFGLDGNPGRAEQQIGLFQEALQWLGGTWANLTSVFELSGETIPPPTTQCTTNCGDTGAGIDPEG